ncbi:MAG: zinc ribbon domain-containing protein [Candidatus Thalassarchaeaceae archaeon]|nr:zinc ribbon domain-containing protein [Candidatus Thalassarchaeaceae archaeon]
MPVYCPSCEAGVEAVAKFCLQCGHDLETDGPITSTGHDVRQLKELIRARDDLSMAEKFDLIAQVEEGSNPIELGLAAPAEGSGVTPEQMEIQAAAPKVTKGSLSEAAMDYTTSPAAAAAVALMSSQTDAWGHIQSGSINTRDPLFIEAMALGMEASHHIHDIAAGGIDETTLTNEDLRGIPVLKPPKRSFCPKCGSDIHSHTMLQWRKWRDHSGEVVQLQAQAAMETSLVQVAAHYLTQTQSAESQRDDLASQLANLDEGAMTEKITKDLRPKILKEVEEELKKKVEDELRSTIEEEVRADMAARGGGRSTVKSSGSSTFKPKPAKKAASPVVRRGAAKKTYEGEPDGKVDWFLSDALDTVFDPHGTGKVLKPKTILARSAEGNVRVQDVVRIYSGDGEDGLSELAWTSPFTKYIIEAFDAC